MPSIDRELVRAINSGRCFAVVGSGPSNEVGALSWKGLAKEAIDLLRASGDLSATALAERFFSEGKYPEVFGVVERNIGRDQIVGLVRSRVEAISYTEGPTYKTIAQWPFACYLTTNYDNELKKHLERNSLAYITRLNSHDDLSLLHSETKDIIFKIHGDSSDPASLIITNRDYDDLISSSSKEYWRDTIFSCLRMMNVFLIGYSAKDPDFEMQLGRAKKCGANPNHPVFMVAADVPLNQIIEYNMKYNIRIISYRNADGTHSELKFLLGKYRPFILSRDSPFLGQAPVNEEQAHVAASLFLFSKLRIGDARPVCINRTYELMILRTLVDSAHPLQSGTISSCIKSRYNISADPEPFEAALGELSASGFIHLDKDSNTFSTLPKAIRTLSTVGMEKEALRSKFQESCKIYLRTRFTLKSGDEEEIVACLDRGIVGAYEKRGMEIARSIFTDDPIDFSDATDVIDAINKSSGHLSDNALQDAYIELLMEILLSPNEITKEYLASLSHGYFAYHALGYDPSCSSFRVDYIRKKEWVVDSSIMIPLLAIDSPNHDYAVDLFRRMKNLSINLYTTSRLCDEVIIHADWLFTNFYEKNRSDQHLLLMAAKGECGFRENVFLTGYFAWSRKQGDRSILDYLSKCFGTDYSDRTTLGIRSALAKHGIVIRDIEDVPGFVDPLFSDRDVFKGEIEKIRQDNDTLKGDDQCVAEAEVVIINKLTNAYFLSHSTVLNRLPSNGNKYTWKPEAMYRLLTLYSGEALDINKLYQSMTQDYFFSGIEIIDKKSIEGFAEGPIRQAKMSFEREKNRYESLLGVESFANYKDTFDRLPDIEKPFYSVRFAYYIASIETEYRARAEERAKKVEKEKELSTGERRELLMFRSKKAHKTKVAKKKRARKKTSRKK